MENTGSKLARSAAISENPLVARPDLACGISKNCGLRQWVFIFSLELPI